MYTDENIKSEIKKYSFYHRIKVKDNIFTRETENEHFSHRRLFKYIDRIDLKNKKFLISDVETEFFHFMQKKKVQKK